MERSGDHSNMGGMQGNRPRRGRRRPRGASSGGGSGSGGGGGNGAARGGRGSPLDILDVADELTEEDLLEDGEAGGSLDVADLKRKPMEELTELSESLCVENAAGMRKQDLIFAILKANADARGRIYSEGVLETLPDGFGFLRSPDDPECTGA
jgi:transcription termination factor Rho